MSLKRIKTTAAIVLILVGICVIVYPWARGLYFDWLQEKAMRLWHVDVSENNLSDEAVSDDVTEDGLWEEDVNAPFDVDYVLAHMEGIITIEKIGLKSPILKNATKKNLDIAICSVEYTGKMGQIGNYVLAGHKSRVYGRHFNRLQEVEVGDTIVVQNSVAEYAYKVDKIISVDPSDVSVLEGDSEKKTITLITCDYRLKPVGRLIVRGVLEQTDAE